MSSLEDKLLGSINKPEKDAVDTATKPVAKKSAFKKPVAKKSVAKKPAAKKPVAKKPAAKKPAAKKPVAKNITQSQRVWPD